MNKRLDKTVPASLYHQLKELILSVIKPSAYRFSELIPTKLVQEDWLYRVKNTETFVSKSKINQRFV